MRIEPSELESFKQAYNDAIESQEISFLWNNDRVLVHYAQYVIEFYEK